MADQRSRVISRRELLRGAGAVGAAAVVGGVGRATPTAAGPPPASPTAQPSSTASPVTYEHLTVDEAELLEAVADRLIPADEHGPGAVEARAVHYIDRALGGAQSDARDAYRSGLAALDRYCRSSRGASFLELSPERPDLNPDRCRDQCRDGCRRGLRGQFRRLLRHGEKPRAPGHVRRPVLRWERQLRGAGISSGIQAYAWS